VTPASRFKRVVLMTLGALLLGTVLPLSQAFAQGNKTVVNYWLWLDDSTDPVWPDLVKEFNQTHPNIEVKYQTIPLSQYHDRLLTAIGSGSAPDAARFKDWWLGEFVSNDLLQPLTSYIQQWPGSSDVIQNLWSTGKTSADSPVYMLPAQYITFYLYYRADRLKAAGLEPPKTFAEFVQEAKTLTDPAKKQYGFALRGGAGGQDQWYAFMLALGCHLVDGSGAVVADSQACVDANQKYIDLFRVDKVTPPTAPSDGFAQIIGGFESGITTFAAHHVGSSKSLTEKLGDKLGVTNVPPADPNKPATMMAMSGNVVFGSSKEKQAAFTFISWLDSQGPMDKMSRSANGQLPVLASVASEPYYQNNPFFKLSLEQANYAVAWPPLPGVGYVASQLWQASMQQALLGQITSQQMMTQIATALKQK